MYTTRRDTGGGGLKRIGASERARDRSDSGDFICIRLICGFTVGKFICTYHCAPRYTRAIYQPNQSCIHLYTSRSKPNPVSRAFSASLGFFLPIRMEWKFTRRAGGGRGARAMWEIAKKKSQAGREIGDNSQSARLVSIWRRR